MMVRANAREFSLTESEKKYCVSLARKSIKYFLENGSKLVLSKSELSSVPKKLFKKKACFVTLMLDGDLKGCIGHLNSFQKLYLDIIDNSVSAAFSDPRFDPLSSEEFDRIKIEISVLTSPKPLNFSDSADLLDKIVSGEDGLIISKGGRSATFLPSVWEELPKKEDFLENLCLKAGLGNNEWKKPGLKVEKYNAIKAKE